MQVKHIVEVEHDDFKPIFDMVKMAALASYPTVTAQDAALAQTEAEFREKIQALVNKAFVYGLHIGKGKADARDTEMYAG